MKIKGTILSSLHDFIKEQFPNRFHEWIENIPDKSKELYTGIIMAAEWYPYREGLIIPSEVAANLFYNGDVEKMAWESGRYSAEVGLKGIYKVFVLIATPQFIMKRGGKIISSYYDESELQIGAERPKGVDIRITRFPQSTVITERRIGGWMERALEICNVKNISIDIVSSIAAGDDETVYVLNWE